MKSREIRRARPLLGTYVEIAAWGRKAGALQRAIGCAFDRIESLQSRLSVHDPASEISRLNREAHRRVVVVSRDTWRLLDAAVRLSRQSAGAFDVTVGVGRSAAQPSRPRPGREASFRDIRLLVGSRVRFARRLRIDLGGIAKGYCVDRAVAELRRRGVASGLVNAGGDLRAFGDRAVALHLRHPDDPRQFVPWGTIRNAALATSASYAAGASRFAGVLLDGRNGVPIGPGVSISVRASRALLADALTKVVAAAGPGAAPMLARHRARAWVLTAAKAGCRRTGRGVPREAACAAAA